jgi:hypothetical protein
LKGEIMEQDKMKLLWEIYDAIIQELTIDDEWRKWGGGWFNPLVKNTVNKARERVQAKVEDMLQKERGIG